MGDSGAPNAAVVAPGQPSAPSELERWWAETRAELRAARLQALEEDPGLPAYHWGPSGERYSIPPGVAGSEIEIPLPVSFVDIARNKLRPVFNLDALHTSVLDALRGQPDTRTHAQRRSDDWKAYQEAKKRWS